MTTQNDPVTLAREGSIPWRDLPRFVAVATIGEEGTTLTIVDLAGNTIVKTLCFDWDTFRPASAMYRLTEHGYRITPAAMLAHGNLSGWKEISAECSIAPVAEV